jgi:hypothetical protein
MAQQAAGDTTDAVRDVVVEASRTQLAALSASASFWSAWAQSSATFAQNASREIARLTDQDVNSDDVVVRMTDLTREYLRRLTELPEEASKQFRQELEGISGQTRRPKRAARAKE